MPDTLTDAYLEEVERTLINDESENYYIIKRLLGHIKALSAPKLTVQQLEILNALNNGCDIVSFGALFSLACGVFEVGKINVSDLQLLIDSGHIDAKKQITPKGIEALTA